jgi:hypothetical protein
VSILLSDVEKALKVINWTIVRDMADGEEFGIVLDGQHKTVVKLQSDDHRDSDYERDIYVVVGIGGQFFKKTGYMSSDSHCYGYGDEDVTWNHGLSEVRPDVRPVTHYV